MPPPVPWPYLFFIFTSCSSPVVHGASGLSPLTLGGSARPSLSWPFFSLFPLSLPVTLSFPLTLPVSALFHCIVLSMHGISYLCLTFAVKPAIVQLQRHGRLDVAPPHFVHLVHISVKLHLSFPPASIWWQFRLSLLAGAALTMPLKAIAESIVAPAIFISWYLRVVPSSSGTH